MTTVFKIIGGGQRIQQNLQHNLPINYIVDENSDYPEVTKVDGQDSYTNTMWSTSLDSIQRWANDWAGQEVELTEAN